MRQDKNVLKVDSFAKAGLVLAVIIIFILLKLVFIDKDDRLDIYFANLAIVHRGDTLSKIMFLFTRVGNQETMIILYLIVISAVLFYVKDKTLAIKMTLIALSTVSLMHILKIVFRRDRPLSDFMLEADGYSFPSGHTMNSFVLFFLLIYLSNRFIKDRATRNFFLVLFIFIPTLIGFSRIYIGVHFFTDVLAGLCFGYIWFYIANMVLDNMFYTKKAP